MDGTTITHSNGTKIVTTSTAPARPLATKISGTQISKDIREELKDQVALLQAEHNVTPGLAVVLVGERPDSATYVRMKKKAAAEIGFHSVDVSLPDTATTVRARSSPPALALLSSPAAPAGPLLRGAQEQRPQHELLAEAKPPSPPRSPTNPLTPTRARAGGAAGCGAQAERGPGDPRHPRAGEYPRNLHHSALFGSVSEDIACAASCRCRRSATSR